MPLFNDTLVWLLKRRLSRIEAFMQDPTQVQEEQFTQLIQAGKNTEWGQKYQYRDIKNYQHFQNQVPISTYEDLYPYIERLMRGEQYLLWNTPVSWFAKSSGTTNARSKYIPVSKESLQNCHYAGGKDLMALFINHRPDTQIYTGKGLSVGGSLSANPFSGELNCGDVSAVIMKNLPSWGQYIRTPDLETALISSWEQKLERMAEVTSQENVTSILGVPTWTLVLIEKILALTNKTHIQELWPNFEVFVHGAVAFQPYRELFQHKVFSGGVNYLEIYNASEGCFAIQDDFSKPDEMLLMLDYGIFYEFIPMEEWHNEHPKTLTLGEVELHQNYAMVITTNVGLWRYKIGDTVRFTSKNPYRIKVSGRTKHFINAFGEELIVENADVAITRACEATQAEISDYTAAPAYMNARQSGCHEWAIEFKQKPNDIVRFVAILDHTLREVNSDYDAKRHQDFVLTPPKVHVLPEGTFYAWLGQKGKLGGQHKVPRLSNDREYLEQILGSTAIEY